MKAMDWLTSGNANIAYLVNVNLLDGKEDQLNDGYIGDYMTLCDPKRKMWGDGLYGPKWVSTTYTLLELISLKASVNQAMMDASDQLLQEMTKQYTLDPKDKKTLDLCIVGMLLNIGSYVKMNPSKLENLIDFALYTVNKDGAWNCYFNYRAYKTSSLHTTINMLEGLLQYVNQGYTYRLEEVTSSMKSAHEFILKKKLFRSRRTNHIIHKLFTKIHYPVRWYYDFYRALEYFRNAKVPYDERMEEALEILRQLLSKGPLPKGPTYTGKVHFTYQLEDYKRINTLRALTIVKQYDLECYHEVIQNPSFIK